MAKILIAEDNISLRQLMCIHLERAGHKVFQASDGIQALEVMDHNAIDLIVADIMMPNMDGYKLIEELRHANMELPVLIVTAKDTMDDKRTGFRSGADDYMTKPVDMEEMILRVEALLRRCKIVNTRSITVGNTKLDFDTLMVHTDKGHIELRKKEFELLEKMLASPMKIFTRQALMDDIWGYDSDSASRTVDAHIKRLRAKLKDVEDFEIETIRGLGYKAVIRK